MNSVPPEGLSLTLNELRCDPYYSLCRTPLYVWETKCKSCGGSGVVSAAARGAKARRLGACPTCCGVGVVRYVSTDETSVKAQFTVNRDPMPPPKTPSKYAPKPKPAEDTN